MAGAGHRCILDDRGSHHRHHHHRPAFRQAAADRDRLLPVGRRHLSERDPWTQDPYWLANLAAQPQFTFHLKHGLVADLPATATVIGDPAERRRVLAVFVEEFNRRHGPDSPWSEGVLDEWVERSPLAKVTFEEAD